MGGADGRRIRKIKCDETKPFCRQCTNTGRRCDGYKNTEGTPSDQSARSTSTPDTPTAETPSPSPALSLIPCRTIHEARYLSFYCNYIVRIIHAHQGVSGYAPLVIRLVNLDSVTREATIALALHFEAHTAGSQSQFSYNVPLMYYNRAMHATRNRLVLLSKEAPSANVDTWRALLVTSLQFIGLELLQGNIGAAQSHFQSFSNIIKQYNLGSFEVGSASGTFGQLCYRMGLSLRTFPHFATFTRDHPKPIEHPGILEEGPLYFSSKRQVLYSWYALLADFLNLVHDVSSISGNLTLESELAIGNMTGRIHRWCSALELSFAARQRDGEVLTNDEETIILTHSRTMILRLRVRLKDDGEACYDSFTESFEEIMSLIRAIPPGLQERQSSQWLHASTLASAFFVAVKCRDPDLRRGAIQIMEQWSSWPGMWHSRTMSCIIAKRIVEIEEPERVLSAADVTERDRIRNVNVKIDHGNRGAWLRYTAWIGSGLEEKEESLRCNL